MNEPSGWVIAGRYRVLERIGTGGMADVLRARDEVLNRDVAVKVFRTVVAAPDGTQDTAKGVERQRAELAALARLNHPNLTTLYDGSIVGQQGPAYLVMELIEGPSMAQAIADGTLTETGIRTIGAQIADALAYVHSAGMVHRDVKPANILLGRSGRDPRARLTDFGIVRLVGNEPLTRADMTLGSASYLAPEQARGSAVGPPADVYALGLTLLEALTGRRSFDGPALEAVVARLSSDPDIPPGLPQPWPGLLRAMVERDPARRPPASRVAEVLRGGAALTAPIASVPAGTYDRAGLDGTAVLPAVAAGLPLGTATRGSTSDGTRVIPSAAATGSHGPAPAGRRGRRWSASLIIAALLVLALIVAGVALLVANSGGSGSPDPGSGGSSSPRSTSTRRTSPSRTSSRPTRSTPTTRRSSTQASTTPTSSSPSTSPTSPSSSASSSPSSSPSTSASRSPSTSRSTSQSTSRTPSGQPTTARSQVTAPAKATPTG